MYISETEINGRIILQFLLIFQALLLYELS